MTTENISVLIYFWRHYMTSAHSSWIRFINHAVKSVLTFTVDPFLVLKLILHFFISATFLFCLCHFLRVVYQPVTGVSVDGCRSFALDSSTSCLLQVLRPACHLSGMCFTGYNCLIPFLWIDDSWHRGGSGEIRCGVWVYNCSVLCLCRGRTGLLCLLQVS